MTVRIGTSGWVYPPWRGVYYPKGLVQKKELAHLSGQVTSIEINGSFYSLQRPASYQKWRDETPDGFVFAAKGPRFVTHLMRLKKPDETLANFFASGILALGPKLGPVLWQLPANFKYDHQILTDFFRALPHSTQAAAKIAKNHDERMEGRQWTVTDADRPLRHAMEVRNPDFMRPEFTELARAHNIALVIADTANKWPEFTDVTADFVYARLHGHEELYAGRYPDERLDAWAEKIREWQPKHDVYVYFDNDDKAHAPHDAIRLIERVTQG